MILESIEISVEFAQKRVAFGAYNKAALSTGALSSFVTALGACILQDNVNFQIYELPKMADRELQDNLRRLKSTKDYATAVSLLSKAKILLLKLNALTPTPQTPKPVLLAARELFETGALVSIRNKNSEGFTRYVNQLQPFYELPEALLPAGSERNKITGLFLLLLLVKGDYAGFHTELEGLETRGSDVESDKYLGYPVKLERWLMEGSYDRVWKAMASREVPSEEYGVFSEVSCSCVLWWRAHLYVTICITKPRFHV